MRREPTFAELVGQARALVADGRRALLGICGPPGAGKSTLAGRLAEDTGAVVVGMDGFHLAQAELDRLGRAERKGAPDTFDRAGYANLLRRLRANTDDVVYAPEFRRDLEEPIACAVPVPMDTALVVTEGNYLLLWPEIRALLDQVWYLDPDDDLRVRRLVERHVRHGRTQAQARERTLGSDQRNADLVASTARTADLVLRKIQ